jgi:hypothetical protein
MKLYKGMEHVQLTDNNGRISALNYRHRAQILWSEKSEQATLPFHKVEGKNKNMKSVDCGTKSGHSRVLCNFIDNKMNQAAVTGTKCLILIVLR